MRRVTSIVTGGAGFLGSHLVDALVRRGEAVICIDNLSTGSLRNVAGAISSGQTTFVFADVAGPLADLQQTIAELRLDRLDCIYHLASPASPAAYGAHPLETLAVNGPGTLALIEIALAARARFVYASTSEIYGDPLEHPQPESYFGNVNPIGPRACYDEGKRFGEAAVAAAVGARGLDGRIVRFFNCYGPRMDRGDGRLIPALIDAVTESRPFPIHGSGAQTRSLTFVDDAIDLLLRVADRPQTSLAPVNIGNDDERSVEEIARVLARILDRPYVAEHVPARPEDPQRRRPELTRARTYDWEPATPLEAGLRATTEWFAREGLAYA